MCASMCKTLLTFLILIDICLYCVIIPRSVAFGLASVVLGLSIGGGNANGAARRPPPPPPQEKKDPNVSGVLAKVLASKKRKEAMKESIAKLKEKGKAIQEPSQ